MSKTIFLHNLQTSKSPLGFFLRPILYIVSVFYSVIIKIRNKLYDYQIKKSNILPAPVVCIGNITAGGTGKTPILIWLLQNLPIKKRKPILVSRGYGGDEEQLFAKQLPLIPHYTNSKRFIAGTNAIKEHGKDVIFFLDDGFQHRQLQRNLNIVLIDATCPFGYEYILPRGFLREPLSGLKRADVFIFTRCDMVSLEELEKISLRLDQITDNSKLKIFSRHTPHQFRNHFDEAIKPLSDLQGQKAFVFCGIGNPESFYYCIEQQKITIAEKCSFDDHFAYNEESLQLIVKKAQECNAEIMITTAKDAVKIPISKSKIPLWILDITITIDRGEQELFAMISQLEHFSALVP